MSIKLIRLFLLFGCLLVCLVELQDGEKPNNIDGIDDEELKKRRQLSIKMANLFNFQHFKSIFGKRYGSFVEELARQKIMLGRAFQAFVSMANYLHNRSSYYLGINSRSDQTLEERKLANRGRLRLSRGDISLHAKLDSLPDEGPQDLEAPEESVDDDSQELSPIEAPIESAEMPVAEPEDIEQEFRHIEQHSSEPGFHELAEQLREMGAMNQLEQQLTGERRSPGQQPLSTGNSLAQNGPGEASEAMRGQQRVLSSHESDKRRQESQETGEPGIEEQPKQLSLSDKVIGSILRLTGAHYLRRLIERMTKAIGKMKLPSRRRKKEDNKMFVDLRTTGCLWPPRNQKNCGSCYAFAAVAAYEYIYCRTTGQLVQFSEQYMISCGHRQGMFQCDGATMVDALDFVAIFGLELAEDMPYLAKDEICPYDPEEPAEKMGFIKPKWQELAAIKTSKISRSMEELPMLIGLDSPADFDDYGGGVHSGKNCQEENGHAMLVVGHGIENGRAFYLIRGSYGTDWGEGGYFKIEKKRLKHCSEEFAIIPLAKFSKYDFQEKIKKRHIKLARTIYVLPPKEKSPE